MSGADAALRAARLGDEVVHGFGLMGMVAGALIGAAVAAAIIVAGVATGGLAIAIIIGGCIAGGGLAGGSLARGIMKAADLPGPTTGVLAAAGPSRVSVNGRMALRAGMDFSAGCSGAPMNHFTMPAPVLIAEGSRTVTINGKPMARQSMKLVCGAKIKGGSNNVTVGGPTICVVKVTDYEEMFETGLQVLGFAALGGAGLGAIAAGIGATLVFGGVVAGSMLGIEALHSWGESLGPGYGDIIVGAVGFATLGIGIRAAKTPSARGAIDALNRTEVKINPNKLGSNLGNIEIGMRPKTQEPFVGKLRGAQVELPNVKTQRFEYIKRAPDEARILRSEFDKSGGARETFLKGLASDSNNRPALKEAGLTENDISGLANGRPPKDWQVHHKRPLDDGGDNSAGNLVLIKNEPYHKTITNEQRSLTGDMKPGDSRIVDFPIPDGFIYPKKAN